MKIEPGSIDSFFSRLNEDHHELQNMVNFCRTHSCLYNPNARPSKDVWRGYGLNPERMTSFIWWLLEQYLEGNLIEKENAQSK